MLVHLLQEGSPEAHIMAAQALMMVGNLNVANQDAIREAGGITVLVDLLQPGSVPATCSIRISAARS
ncbi:hypothetical protein WJX72_005750 [[Myrmecia] bisecta]|uniref:Armadillo segment polarity protein n=1 Tax=[Myrmecia] bisecta TaxID=41462 RepID=A0AAW1PX12_9CHLO